MSENNIDKLNIEIKSSAAKAYKELEKTAQGLEKISTSLGGIDVSKLTGITTGLDKIASIPKMNNLNSIANGLKNLNSGIQGISAMNSSGLSSLSQNLKEIETVVNDFKVDNEPVATLKAFGSGLKDFVNGAKNLDRINFDTLDDDIEKLTNAIKPLTDEMLRAGPAASAYGTQMKDFVEAAKSANKIRSSASGGFYSSGRTSFKLLNLSAFVGVIKQIGSEIGKTVKSINSYIENMNLFTVAMGEYAEAGRDFAENMEIKLGIDSGESMRYMGFFQQLTTSFGALSNQSFVLSKNLTQLGYDIASFYNLTTDEAFLKLQSGIAGRIFCLIRKGLRIVTCLHGGPVAHA